MLNTIIQIIINLIKYAYYFINWMRNCILNIFLIFLILIFLNIYLQVKKNNMFKKLSLYNAAALKINLVGTIVDQTNDINADNSFFKINSEKTNEISLFSLVKAIRHAKNDKNITGIVLDLKQFIGADQDKLNYLGKSLIEFKKSKKPIYAISDNYNQLQYYLASFANIIYIYPQGKVDLQGLSNYKFFYKSFLEKLKINSHVFRIGNYKTAVEPFIRDQMSNNAKKMDSKWINKLWKNYISIISKNRNINENTLFPPLKETVLKIKNLEGDNAKYAKINGLIDKISSQSEIDYYLNKKFGYNQLDQSFNNINIYDYLELIKNVKKIDNKDNNIALIIINGTLMSGESTSDTTGSQSIIKQIRWAKLDNSIKAIILRINSPGGSLNASEEIRSELLSVRNVGKPIIVSMGSVAASGGYWISTPANFIIANKITLTGSIGVFSIFHTIEKLLHELGINSDGTSTSPLAEPMNSKGINPEIKKLIQLNIEHGYYTFLDLVSKSRHKPLDQIKKIAQGIIWTGEDAKKHGLIDELGDFDDALKKASELANLKDYNLYMWHEEPEILDFLLNRVILSINNYIIQNIIPKSIKNYNYINKNEFFDVEFFFQDPKNRYVLCLDCYKDF